jgi:hypothetical protein
MRAFVSSTSVALTPDPSLRAMPFNLMAAALSCHATNSSARSRAPRQPGRAPPSSSQPLEVVRIHRRAAGPAATRPFDARWRRTIETEAGAAFPASWARE